MDILEAFTQLIKVVWFTLGLNFATLNIIWIGNTIEEWE